MKKFLTSTSCGSIAKLKSHYESMSKEQLIDELLKIPSGVVHSIEPLNSSSSSMTPMTKRRKHENKVGIYGCRLIALRISYLGTLILA